MKVLITNSPLHYSHGHTLTQPDWQTLVLPTLAGIVGPHRRIRLVDNMSGVWRSNRVLEEIQDFKPGVVMFSIIAGRDIHNTIKLIKQVRARSPRRMLMAGGQGASFYDKELLEAGVDCVVRGEGERKIQWALEAMSEMNRKRLEHLTSLEVVALPGISFLSNNQVCRTPDAERIKSLDDSPFPRWDLMPMRRSKWFPGRFTGSVETSRGCPFTCNFCAITSFWEGSFRRKSPERVVNEMSRLVKQGRSHIYLADDNFGMGSQHHMELFDLILKSSLDVKFFAQMRTDTIAEHPDMVALAARAGLYGALIGFDTYDKDTFHHIAKKGSIELNNECSRVLRKNNIMIFGSHIYGLPSQKDPLDFLSTYWSGRRNSDLFRMPHFSLLPGTKLYDQTITEEIVKGTADKTDFRMLGRSSKERKRFLRWYTILTLLNVLLPDEWLTMIFHPNRNVRVLKRRGYVGMARFWFYKYTGVLR